MAKIRVHELAKQLEIESKDVVSFLAENGIEVKSQSGLDEQQVSLVEGKFSKKAAPKKETAPVKEEKPAASNEEAPKKKRPVGPDGEERPRKKRPAGLDGEERPRKKQVFVYKPSESKGPSKGPNGQPRQMGGKPENNNEPRKPIRPREHTDGLRPSQRHSVPEEEFVPVTKPAEKSEQPKKFEKTERAERSERKERPVRNDKTNDRPNKNDKPNRGNGSGDRRNDNKKFDNNHKGGDDNKKKVFTTTNEKNSGLSNQQPENSGKGGRKDNKKKSRDNEKNDRHAENTRGLEKKTGYKKFTKVEKTEKRDMEELITITIPDYIAVKDLAAKMLVDGSAVVKSLFMKGKMISLNQEVSFEEAEEIALEFNCICEHEEKVDVIAELLKEDEENEEKMITRPPVVCVMGHVDHGKTSLLDAIRDTKVTAREAGGITQHIGAYMVECNGKPITFLDTPGHEAFTAMRMRGASSTDIAILVVAADDGVMPQTVEAINHAKAAGVEIIVAINKIDKPNANIDRVKQELSEYELISEDWGGSTVFVPVSAKTHEGIDTLLEMVLLTAEVMELKANPKRNARGLVIEAQLDKGRGAVATMLVQKGTLKKGDFVACGKSYGRVRALINDDGKEIKAAGPSTPVEILGLKEVPGAGEVFVAMDSEKEARSFAETFINENKNKMVEDSRNRMSLDDLFNQIQQGNLKELNIIVKADVQGSVEAVKQSLIKLSNEEVLVKVIHGGVGAINESDIILASASNAIIIGFNVRPDAQAKQTAEQEGVDVRLYKVIYQAIEDVEAAMKGMLDPIFEEQVIGHAEVRQIFKASGLGNIAGSYVLDGRFERDALVRVQRAGDQIFEGKLASLKRFKDDVKEVKSGFECGLVLEDFDSFEEGDIIEAYIMVEVPR